MDRSGGPSVSSNSPCLTVPEVIALDHSYSKPSTAINDYSVAKPVRNLFIPKEEKSPGGLNSLESQLDIVSTDGISPEQCKSHHREKDEAVKLFRAAEPNLEQKLLTNGWSPYQIRLYRSLMSILDSDRLARLSCAQLPREPILKRNLVNKSAKKIRELYSSIYWDVGLLIWLHQQIAKTLSDEYLANYLDILQTVRAKVPKLVDHLTDACAAAMPEISGETLKSFLKKPWTPMTQSAQQHKTKRLPIDTVLMQVASSPFATPSKRMKHWHQFLSHLGKATSVNLAANPKWSMDRTVDEMIAAIIEKMHDVGGNEPIVLVGWNFGALLACYVALVEKVAAIVCLGFPLIGLDGGRGDADDPLLDLRVPILFVVGENALRCPFHEMEDYRSRLSTESNLLLLGGCNDFLRMNDIKRQRSSMTQQMVDKAIQEEVGQFLHEALMKHGQRESSNDDLNDTIRRRLGPDPTEKGLVEIHQLIDINVDSPTPKKATKRARASVDEPGRAAKTFREGSALSKSLPTGGLLISAETVKPSLRISQGSVVRLTSTNERSILVPSQPAVSNPLTFSILTGEKSKTDSS